MKDIKMFLNEIGIINEGNKTDGDTYVIDLLDSEDYGKMYSKLEKSNNLNLMDENQVVTEQGSSLVYEAKEDPFILNLIADFEGDKYQLVINYIGD